MIGGSCILKGCYLSAQGCEERATLGNPCQRTSTLKGLHPLRSTCQARRPDITLLGLRGLRRDTPGQLVPRNPGLSDRIPLGFPAAGVAAGENFPLPPQGGPNNPTG